MRLEKISRVNKQRTAEFLRVPVNLEGVPWKVFKLYVRFLDLKCQSPDLGIFTIMHSHRRYQYDVKAMITRGWAERRNGEIYLRAYPFVWRQMGVQRVRVRGILKFKYWKIPIEGFSPDRKDYLKEMESEIRKRMALRKAAQIRRALQIKGTGNNHRATFAGMSASLLFGYASTFSGSKLRKSFFELLPQTEEEAKPYYNKIRGRFENRTREIAL